MPDNASSHKPWHRYERSTVTIRGLSFVAYGLIFGGMGGLAALVALFGVVGYPGRYLLYPFMLAAAYGYVLVVIKDDRILDPPPRARGARARRGVGGGGRTRHSLHHT